MFGVGDLVVCVDDSAGEVSKVKQLERGRVYTVRGFVLPAEGKGWVRRDVGVLLEEVVSTAPPHFDGSDRAFRMSRFRPVRKTSIEQFRKLVEPVM